MTNYTHNHDRTAKQSTIDEYNSIVDVSNTLTISILEDLRGDECSFSTDPTVISNVLADFSGDARYKLEVSEDLTAGGLILRLSDSKHPPIKAQVHNNMIGCTERDPESGLLWYGRGTFPFDKNGGK